jgi:hypothetical protein
VGDGDDTKDIEVSLLHIACLAGNIETVNSVLLYAGTVETLLGKIGRWNNPMHAAIVGKGYPKERLSCVRRLFETFSVFQKEDTIMFYLQTAIYACAWRIVKYILKWYVDTGKASSVSKMIHMLSYVAGEPCPEHMCFVSCVVLPPLKKGVYTHLEGCSECAFQCISAIRDASSGSYSDSELDTLVQTHTIAKKGEEGYVMLQWQDRRIRARLDPMVWKEWVLTELSCLVIE